MALLLYVRVIDDVNYSLLLYKSIVNLIVSESIRNAYFHYNLQVQNVLGVRLACVRHAASVHPEPGSNSQKSKV